MYRNMEGQMPYFISVVKKQIIFVQKLVLHQKKEDFIMIVIYLIFFQPMTIA